MKIRKTLKTLRIGGAIGMAAVMLAAVACGSPAPAATPAGQQAAKVLIVNADMVTGPGGTVKPTASCVNASQYPRGMQLVWRARVYDPATGKPMDDKSLTAVELKLADGQSFKMKYGPHPGKDPTDYFWTTSWIIPASYPTGTLGYGITATSSDGRTGKYQIFDVAPSLLTITT